MSPIRIGVFDSGWGGLSIAKSIINGLPHTPLVYVADSANRPYGDKTQSQILERARHITQKLIALNCDLIVVACNTATVNTINTLRQEFPVPFVGVEPGIKPGLALSQNKKLGVLVTQRTADSPRFTQFCQRFSSQGQVLVQACPGLMEQVEKQEIQTAATREMLEFYLTPLMEQNIDTLVLGCTHYPFLQPIITSITQSKVNIVNTSDAVARQVKRLWEELVLSRSGDLGVLADENGTGNPLNYKFYTTGDVAKENPAMCHLWGDNASLNPL